MSVATVASPTLDELCERALGYMRGEYQNFNEWVFRLELEHELNASRRQIDLVLRTLKKQRLVDFQAEPGWDELGLSLVELFPDLRDGSAGRSASGLKVSLHKLTGWAIVAGTSVTGLIQWSDRLFDFLSKWLGA